MVSKVSIVECKGYNEDKIYKALKKALKDIGFKLPTKKRVLIKPNVLGGFRPAEAVTTHPTFVAAVCMLLRENENEIIIGESSGFVGSTKKSLEESGIQEVANRYNIEAIPFESTEIENKKIKGKILDKVAISKIISEVDMVINLPKMKTHSLMTYTGAVKNLFGLVPGGRKPDYHCKAQTPGDFAELLVDLYQTVKPLITLNLMDAIVGMEGNGPSAGNPKETGLVLASEDAVALDTVALKITGLSTPLMAALKKRDLYPEDVKIIGDLKKVEYKKPSAMLNIEKIPKFLRNFMQNQMVAHPEVTEKECIKCGICEKGCPVKAIELKPYPIFDRETCIDCYCCHELCPQKAIYLKRTILMRFIWSLLTFKKKFQKKE